MMITGNSGRAPASAKTPAPTEHRHPQVTDNHVESFFRVRKFLHYCNWIRYASDLHAFTGKHLSHCPEHSRIVVYHQNRFIVQLVHNLSRNWAAPYGKSPRCRGSSCEPIQPNL